MSKNLGSVGGHLKIYMVVVSNYLIEELHFFESQSLNADHFGKVTHLVAGRIQSLRRFYPAVLRPFSFHLTDCFRLHSDKKEYLNKLRDSLRPAKI